MKALAIFTLIVIGIIILIVLFFYFKPFVIRHDTTTLFTGGLGSGKTLESVKLARVLILKNIFIEYYIGNFKRKVINRIRRIRNFLRYKKYKKLSKTNTKKAENYRKRKPLLNYEQLINKPLLYSNIPIRYRNIPFNFFAKKIYSTKLTIRQLTCLEKQREYSVVLIDELPQLVNQFNWDEKLVQENLNEYITFFRHYVGGYAIFNCQSEDEVECHIRRKLNIGTWCFNLRKWPLPIKPFCWFYTVRMCNFMMSENITTMSTTYIEENTRIHFGLFPRKAYASRCYKPRYDKALEEITDKWKALYTKEVLRMIPYISPLDTETTDQQIKNLLNKVKKLQERNKDE